MSQKNALPPISQIRWLQWLNNTGTTVPAWGLIASGGTDQNGVITGVAATTAGQFVYVNGPGAVLPSGQFAQQTSVGSCTKDSPCWAAYATGDGTPALGDTWGPNASGDFLLHKGQAGFIVEGQATTGTGARVWVRRQPATSSLTVQDEKTPVDTVTGATLLDFGRYPNALRPNCISPDFIVGGGQTAGSAAICMLPSGVQAESQDELGPNEVFDNWDVYGNDFPGQFQSGNYITNPQANAGLLVPTGAATNGAMFLISWSILFNASATGIGSQPYLYGGQPLLRRGGGGATALAGGQHGSPPSTYAGLFWMSGSCAAALFDGDLIQLQTLGNYSGGIGTFYGALALLKFPGTLSLNHP